MAVGRSIDGQDGHGRWPNPSAAGHFGAGISQPGHQPDTRCFRIHCLEDLRGLPDSGKVCSENKKFPPEFFKIIGIKDG